MTLTLLILVDVVSIAFPATRGAAAPFVPIGMSATSEEPSQLEIQDQSNIPDHLNSTPEHGVYAQWHMPYHHGMGSCIWY